jgi:hypothetical protein
MIRFIFISIFILVEVLFNRYCPSYTLVFDPPAVELTNWSIIYFVGTYLCVTGISIHAFFTLTDKLLRDCFLIYSSFFVFLMILDVRKWGLPYDEYLSAVTNRFPNMFFHLFLLLAGSIIVIEAWYKYLKIRQWRKIQRKN